MRKFKVRIGSLAPLLPLAWSALAFGHAFPEQSSPGAGATLKPSPPSVVIRFDSDLEPVFSKLVVKNAQNVVVTPDNGRVDPANSRILEAKMPALPPGVYHVYWHVVARDGHTTEGDYTFTVG